MRASVSLRVAATLALLLLAFAGAWNHDPWVYDEPRELELARHMARSGEWLTTTLCEQPFLEKPPLFTVSIAAAFRAIGPSVLAARWIAAAWAFGAVLVTALAARKLIGPAASLPAALALATTARFHTMAHTIILDDALLFFTTSAILAGHLASSERRPGLGVLCGLAVAGAFLTKGLVGVAIVGVVLGLDVLFRRSLGVALLAAIPAALVPIGLYVRALPEDAVRELLWNNSVGRFSSGYLAKDYRWWFYLETAPEMLLPWLPVSLLGLAAAVRERAPATRFLATWAVAPLVLLSLSAAKGRFYPMPTLPAFSVLAVFFFLLKVRDGAHRAALEGLVLVAGLGVPIAAAVALAKLAFSIDALLVGGSAIAVVAALRFRKARTREAQAILAGLVAVGACLLLTSAPFARRGDALKSFQPLARKAWEVAGSRRLVLFHLNDSQTGAFPFLGDRSCRVLDEVQDPRGEALVAVLASDVAIAPEGALGFVDPVARRELEVLATELGPGREGDRKRFVIFRRRDAAR